MLAGVVSNAITGAGQETIELGITASGEVASVVAPLAETRVAAAAGWAEQPGRMSHEILWEARPHRGVSVAQASATWP
jgi:hypothetical protein